MGGVAAAPAPTNPGHRRPVGRRCRSSGGRPRDRWWLSSIGRPGQPDPRTSGTRDHGVRDASGAFAELDGCAVPRRTGPMANRRARPAHREPNAVQRSWTCGFPARAVRPCTPRTDVRTSGPVQRSSHREGPQRRAPLAQSRAVRSRWTAPANSADRGGPNRVRPRAPVRCGRSCTASLARRRATKASGGPDPRSRERSRHELPAGTPRPAPVAQPKNTAPISSQVERTCRCSVPGAPTAMRTCARPSTSVCVRYALPALLSASSRSSTR